MNKNIMCIDCGIYFLKNQYYNSLSLVKVGRSMNFEKRLYGYLTCLPDSYYEYIIEL